MSKNKQTLYLVDVSGMFFRAFFAIPPLTNDKGLQTNALYGFLNMSLKLLRECKPDYLGFCFDRKEPSFRHEMYQEYKAHRDEMPEGLVPQVPYIRKITEVLGVRGLEAATYEADDVIGTYARRGREQGLDVTIVSGDKDFAQLIGPHVTMYDTMKEVRYDEGGVVAKWGIRPEQMVDYLSLVGDSSDNIPGVRGIGPKGAVKLLSEFGTLEGVYQSLDKISAKAMKTKLVENRDMAFLSKKLVTICDTVPLPAPIEELKSQPMRKDEAIALFQELGFKTVVKNLQAGPVPAATAAPALAAKPTAVAAPKTPRGKLTVIAYDEFLASIAPYSEVYALDTGRGMYLGTRKQLALVPIGDAAVGPSLSRRHLKFRGYDLKEIWKILDVEEPVGVFDAALAAYVIRAGAIGDFAETYQNYLSQPLPDVVSPEEYFHCYLELEKALAAQLEQVNGMSVFETIEMPTCPVLYTMERLGVLVDAAALKEQSGELAKDLQALEQSIYELTGGPFNIGSPKQLATVLFEKLQLPAARKTKTGFSTDSDVLEKLKAAHPVAEKLLEYRELSKLKSTYVDALPTMIDARDGRIHTRYRQAVTTTGRLSSVNPNLQNLPIRTPRGRLIREAFVARPGCSLISADYSQIELRILAHVSSDPGLVEAFQADLDVHAATASEVFGVKLADVSKDQRRAAKAVNFGIAYGQGAYGLAETLGIGRSEATDIIGRYFNRFRRVREYMENVVKTGTEQGYVETLFGRRRYLEELQSKNQAVKKFGERAAINAPIQGTAADLVKLAMVRIHTESAAPLLMQVHDELVFECPSDACEDELPIIRKTMEGVHAMSVPLKVNIAVKPSPN